MKTLKYTLLIIAVLLIGFAIYVAVQPNNFDVKRSRLVNAPAAVVFNQVNDFKTWESWSSWTERNPETVVTLPQKTVGVGGGYSWEDKDGVGTMKTLASSPYTSIEQEMQFGDFEPSKITWNFLPNENGQTEVSWNMHSEKVPFMFKLFGVLSGGFDNMIGPDFERSLEKLDSITIAAIEKHKVEINGITDYTGVKYIYNTTTTPTETISNAIGEQFGKLVSYLTEKSMTPSGFPFTIYPDPKSQSDTQITMSNAIPVENEITIDTDNDIQYNAIPKIKVLKTTLIGNYTYLSIAWEDAYTFIERNGMEINTDIPPFEVYANDPGLFANPADWITEIYIPIK